jgi:major membrane immunogen (membrane-anchored lipoprotein)
MRQTILRPVLLLLAIACAATLLVACGQLEFSRGPLLYDVSFSNDRITPNADGDNDATEIKYSLRRPANVTISFEDDKGGRYYFRENRRRAEGDYSVLWGGVVDEPQMLETSYGPVQVLSRVLPDGVYKWTVDATDDGGQSASASGNITLQDGDTELPELHNFVVVPDTFRPNQDGLRDDWVSISYYLNKDVDHAQLFIQDPANPAVRTFIAEAPGVIKPNERGYHEYRYEGGVDLNAEPPPDGTYNIVGEARDKAGNAIRVERALTIEEGGKPRADVAQGEIDWEREMNRIVSVALGEKVCFTTVVTNEGTVPIRTSGPWPGQEYKFGENYNTLANQGEESWLQQAGVWRFGINFDTTGIDFPYRWAVGRQEDLEKRIIDGEEQWYLMPGTSGQVNGCIVIDEKPPIGTTFWWGGLIHQNVEVANNNIDRISVLVGVP